MKRNLKVYALYRRHEQNRAHYGPMIRLQGDWLERAGVKPGDHITVEIHGNQITITKLDPEQTQPTRSSNGT